MLAEPTAALLQAGLFRVPPNEAVTLDPQHRVLMEQTLLAFANAGADAAAQTTGEHALGCAASLHMRPAWVWGLKSRLCQGHRYSVRDGAVGAALKGV